ncbi:MAG: DUF1499 domain-containing protein [Anaerolineae bacterium]|nr:DUF1499 domain-containing protein [Anaerolineae bacterium]
MLIGIIVVLAGIGFLLRRELVTAISPVPKTIGLQNGKLAPCPASPNCVSTEATTALHQIAPISLVGTPAQAQDKLLAALKTLPNVNIVTNSTGYVHAEFRTPGMGYIDDAEFVLSDGGAGNSRIDFRSASRLGRGDMGVNRRSMEAVRAALSSK